MRLITAQNACYYRCDAIIKEGREEPMTYKTVDEIKNSMRKQIHPDLEIKKPAPLVSGADKAIEAKKKEIEQAKKLEPLIEGIKEAMQPKPQAPQIPAVGGANEDTMKEEKDSIVKDIMKNKSKSIIQKIMNKEKNKNRRMGKGAVMKGSGIVEV